ncbi:MAG: GNAT family N-acetyltransferase [Patescibacteria group bacterium]|nr:GNAT family N-acetyltransferase [Patescibacteria group bacterium]MCL6096592.1 GNAT family N-acetyltransferase [Patescibacteria group bacterium]
MIKENSFKKRIFRIFENLKKEIKDPEAHPIIPIFDKKIFIGFLRVLSVSSLESSEDIGKLAAWRKKHNWWFPAQFKVTVEGTKKWLDNLIFLQKDRLLFMVETPSGIPFGHMGFFRFDFKDRSCEVDNIVRGENIKPGAMTPALKALIEWAFSTLKIRTLYLTTYYDNERATVLYERCGFRILEKIPLKKIKEGNIVKWEEDKALKGKAERYDLKMILDGPST